MNKTPIKFKACVVRLDPLPLTPKQQQLGLSAELRNVINERNILTARTKKRVIDDLSDLDKATAVEIKRKNQAFQEILDSELAYISQLEVLIKFFMDPIMEKGLMLPIDFDVVFGNIETIYKVHEELVKELEKNLSNLAVAFLRLAPFFKLYSVYAYNYTKALTILDSAYKRNALYAKFLRNQQTRPEVQTKLTSLLIAPIQRIPRYCLLLQQVLDNSRETDVDYDGILESLKHVKKATQHINNHIADHEQAKRLIELRYLISGCDDLMIKPGRKLIKEGPVIQIADKQLQFDIYAVLLTDVLLICHYRNANTKRDWLVRPHRTCKCRLKVSHTLPIHKCRLRVDNKTKVIEIMCEGLIYNIMKDSGSKTDEWFKSIKQAITDCINNRQTLKREAGSIKRPTQGKKRSGERAESVNFGNTPRKRKFSTNPEEDEEIEVPKLPKALHFSPETSNKLPTRPRLAAAFKLCRRKPISSDISTDRSTVTFDRSSIGRTYNGRQPDSLYPLRQYLTNDIDSRQTSNAVNVYRDDVYVFGRNNNGNGGFNMSNVFSGIGGSIKKLFGYKDK